MRYEHNPPPSTYFCGSIPFSGDTYQRETEKEEMSEEATLVEKMLHAVNINRIESEKCLLEALSE